jgi:hypothetical protein
VDEFTATPIGDAIKRQVSAALATIPDHKRGALIVVANHDGLKAQVAARIGDDWQIAAGGGVTWTGDVEGSVAVVGSW